MAELYITIGRQFGSGGREIGKKVAQALGIPYYDKELLAIAAKESGLSQQLPLLPCYGTAPPDSRGAREHGGADGGESPAGGGAVGGGEGKLRHRGPLRRLYPPG